MREWWNKGLDEKSLTTYNFLVKCRVPERVSGLVRVSSWQANINDMLSRIPTITATNNDGDVHNDKGMNAYFDSIDAKLTVYEIVSGARELLVVAIPNDVIVLRVLSLF